MAASAWTFGWDALVAIGTLALAIGTVGLAVATVVTAKQTKKLVASTERGTAVAVVIGLFSEFRTMSPARYRLGPELAKFDADVPLRDLSESVRKDAFDLAHFLDNLGFLVESDFVKAELVQGFMGGSVVDLWDKLGPHIEAERRRREKDGDDPRYQVYFEPALGAGEIRREGVGLRSSRGIHEAPHQRRRSARRANCRVGKIRRARFFSKTARGRVISERPRPGTVLPNGGKVNLVVSRGPKH